MSTESVGNTASTTLPLSKTQNEVEDSSERGPGLPWRWQDALYLLALLGLVVAMAYRYTPHLTGEIAGEWWDPLLNIWTLAWDTTTLLHAPTHLWQAQLLYPNNLTLSYSENLLGEAIIFAPVFLLTRNPVLAYNITFYLTFLLCGISMYIMARHYTGRRFAAFVAALIYAFAPYRLSQIDHIHVIAGEWMPLALLNLDLSLRQGRWRNWILFALFYLLQLLSSVYYGIFLAYTLLAFVLISYSIPFMRRLRSHKAAYIRYLVRRAVRPAIVFTALLVVLVIFMAPYLASLTGGFSRSLGQSTGYAAFVRDFTFASPFNWLYGVSYYNGNVLPYDSEHYLFLGLTTMALALLGVILLLRQKGSSLHPYVWTALLVLLFAFGPVLQFSPPSGSPYVAGASKFISYAVLPPNAPDLPLPWTLAFYVLPGFAGLRVPARLIGVLLIMLALLAAWAIAWLQDRAGAPRERVRSEGSLLPRYKGLALRCLLLLLPVAILLEALPAYLPVTSVPTGKAIPAVYQWLADHGGQEPIVELPMAYFNGSSSFQDAAWYDYYAFYKDEAWYDYYAIYHSHPIANGWSGYRPPLTTSMASLLLNFPSQASVAVLKKYHIYYVVLHLQAYPPTTAANLLTQARSSPDLRRVAQFGNDLVWQVT